MKENFYSYPVPEKSLEQKQIEQGLKSQEVLGQLCLEGLAKQPSSAGLDQWLPIAMRGLFDSALIQQIKNRALEIGSAEGLSDSEVSDRLHQAYNHAGNNEEINKRQWLEDLHWTDSNI